jgi:Anthrone oxygenase
MSPDTAASRALTTRSGNGEVMLAGHLALLLAAVFTGAALYVNVVEQPARLRLGHNALLTEWKPSYKRGFARLWILGALLLVANWPYTLLVIMPTNRKLMATELSNAGRETRNLIEHWARLHAVRTALGSAATVIFLWGSVS